jgi:hypothetical protein
MINSKTKGRANRVRTVRQFKKLIDSGLLPMSYENEDSIVVQPKNQGRFSTESDPHQTQNEGVGIDMRDTHKLYNKFPTKQDILGNNSLESE